MKIVYSNRRLVHKFHKILHYISTALGNRDAKFLGIVFRFLMALWVYIFVVSAVTDIVTVSLNKR